MAPAAGISIDTRGYNYLSVATRADFSFWYFGGLILVHALYLGEPTVMHEWQDSGFVKVLSSAVVVFF